MIAGKIYAAQGIVMKGEIGFVSQYADLLRPTRRGGV
jgi:hypothetical protein